jgi:signal transduction histidine kinase/ActR/RegA family two-component response regulator
MTPTPTLADRVLILAPLGRDSELIAAVLAAEGTVCLPCLTVNDLACAVEEGAAAAIVAEEALIGVSLERLLEVLQGQPSWSDFPLVLLTSGGQEASATSTRLLAVFGAEANITILERPIRVEMLKSGIRSAIRARRRQYEVRDYLAERQRSEEKMLQKQKLESLGVLAGGVAHDFNNLLTGILGNASLALDTVAPGAPVVRMLQDVVEASERAAHLTKQLLAYAGKGRFFVQPVDLSDVVRDISNLIRSSIPKNAQIRLDLAESLPCIEADGAQIQQLVMNLVINAAEAIPENRAGNVIVTTLLQQVDESYLTQVGGIGEIAPGEYVALEVHDTGIGMEPDTLARIFDPFFTTKFAGRGLGLAATHGIVRGHKGLLRVYTTPGQGSTFKVLFPAMAQSPPAAELTPPVSLKSARRLGTVLVIDDEEVVRRSAKAALERGGYDIVLAENGTEGIQLFQALGSKIALVLLDLTMPGPGGEEVLRQIKASSADARVILSSGYNEVEVIQRFTGKGLAGFLQKPYTAAALIQAVNRVLASRPAQ